MKISEPPYFGVSPAAAGAAAPSIAANVAALNATLASRYFFIEPYRRTAFFHPSRRDLVERFRHFPSERDRRFESLFLQRGVSYYRTGLITTSFD